MRIKPRQIPCAPLTCAAARTVVSLFEFRFFYAAANGPDSLTSGSVQAWFRLAIYYCQRVLRTASCT
jgi:hypothetical protein